MKISRLDHRIALCSMKDVVEKNGDMELSRQSIARLWAAIEAAPNTPSFLSPLGYAIMEKSDRRTHRIVIRGRTDIEISAMAWVYEERRKAAPRWYKVLGFTESNCGCWITLAVHLQERSDKAQPPVGDLRPQPMGVDL